LIKNTGFLRLYKAAVFSMQGISAAYRNEAAFRQEIIAAIVLLPLAFWLSVTQVERILLIATVLLVLIVELLNSAVEATVDRIGDEIHELAGRAKDMGSAAVLIAVLLWAYTWVSIVFF